MNYVICHYAEIGLKGKNRRFFEEKLIENIKKTLPRNSYQKVKRISGRILIELGDCPSEDSWPKEDIRQALKNVFGIAYFTLAISCEQDIEMIKKKAIEIFQNKFVTKSRDRRKLLQFSGRRFGQFKTFKVETQRSKKEFSLTSQQINEQVGAEVVKRLKKKVDLKNPDVICFIEIVENYTFLYLEKIPGPGGLPVSVSGKAIALLSGGIDSPVASFYAMKRGIKVIFLHFTSYPFTKQASVEKAKKIVEILNKFQFQSKIYLVPFTEIQKEILLKTKAKLRVVLYRRFMFRIAEVLAKREKAKALITGESVGQVASQTLENIGVIEETIDLPVLRPLIGLDKEDIIKNGREIETFEVSILPAEDCCQRFLPKHPEIKADLMEVKKEENKLDVKKLIEEAIKRSQKLII